MTEEEEIGSSDATTEPVTTEPVTERPSPERVRAARDRLRLRDRIAQEQGDEVSAVFDAHQELQKSIQAAIRSVESALGQCADFDRKCGSPLGRRMFLARRMAVKPLLGVLGTALHHLKKALTGMSAVSRTRDPVVEEASTFGLDY